MAKPKLSKSKKLKTKNLSRKELRKQKINAKKDRKRLYFSSKTHGKELVAAANATNSKKNLKQLPKKNKTKVKPLINLDNKVAPSDDESINSDECDGVEKPAKIAKKGQQREDAEVTRKRVLQQQKALQQKSRKHRIKQMKLENEEEEKVISKLEKKLKLNKTKDKNRLVRKMFSDGLDYLLDFVLDDDEEKQKWEKKQERKKELKEQQEREDNGMWSDDDADETAGEDNDDDVDGLHNESDTESMEQSENDDDVDEAESDNVTAAEHSTLKEDIYGRKRDQHGNVIKDETSETTAQKYIPPHQRAQTAANSSVSDAKQSEALSRLRKQCKGLLNRLSAANLHKIATGIETLYMKNSRHNMNETMTKLLTEALIGRPLTKERMVQEHIVLLAYLHAQIGSEIGAHFLQSFVEQFDDYMKEVSEIDLADKRLNNLLLVLAYMYIFKIYEHNLLLELIARLADNLCEKTIECLLLIFQNVGFKLRKDDPLAFKQMMLNVQQKIAESALEIKENLRLKYMVDVLNAVKNNNMQKLPQYDPELAESLRKQLKAMLRNDRYVVTLNISLADLLRADKIGKWWIVGSAWSGNINEMGSANKTNNGTKSEAATQRYSEQLLALAKKQKMNTAERRNVFCVLMSAADYIDAFEKILHLALKDQRTVAYVIIHCCINERKPNPYYAHLAHKFCQYNRKFQLAFQFASWDRINDMDKLMKPQIHNLAHFLQHLILNNGLQLSVLKIVDFLQLHKLSFYFMKELMVNLLLASEERLVYEAFERIAKNTKLKQFKQSLRLFMQHFLLQRENVKLKLDEEKLQLLEQRINYVDKLLAYVDL